ncbi:MAG: hypothetical protein ACMUEM_02045 [Flavobacteriales bacterium AspAUS03]
MIKTIKEDQETIDQALKALKDQLNEFKYKSQFYREELEEVLEGMIEKYQKMEENHRVLANSQYQCTFIHINFNTF